MKHVLCWMGCSMGIAMAGAPQVAAGQQAAAHPTAAPVTAVAPVSPGTQLVLMVSGEAGRTDFDTALAHALATTGDGVLVLDARVYLGAATSPTQVATVVSATIQRYARAWHRQHLVLVGYSRGADVAPFIANRLDPSVRSQLDGVLLISPSGRAPFELSVREVVTRHPRATDLPVMPELERLRGVPLVCDYGGRERAAFCTRLDSSLVRPVVRAGGHDLDAGDGAGIARLITELLRP